MLTNLGNWVTATFIWMAGLLVVLVGCESIQVGQRGLSIFDLRYENNHCDKDGKSYISDKEITTVAFSHGYTDFSKIASRKAQMVSVRTGTSLPKLMQTRNGGGFWLVKNQVVVDWVLAEGVALQSVVIPPISQPNVIRATSLELLVRATGYRWGYSNLRFPRPPVIDNCQ